MRRAELAIERTDPATAAREMWRELSSPDAAPHERLVFQLYAAGLQGSGAAASFPRAAVEEWLEPQRDLFAAATGDPDQAAVDARLGLATIRGLLLDLLATTAHERYLALCGGFRGAARPEG